MHLAALGVSIPSTAIFACMLVQRFPRPRSFRPFPTIETNLRLLLLTLEAGRRLSQRLTKTRSVTLDAATFHSPVSKAWPTLSHIREGMKSIEKSIGGNGFRQA